MRSDLIFGALTHVNNRYELCQLASKATRKLHKPNTRLQDTTNEVLDRFKDTVPMDAGGSAAARRDRGTRIAARPKGRAAAFAVSTTVFSSGPQFRYFLLSVITSFQ